MINRITLLLFIGSLLANTESPWKVSFSNDKLENEDIIILSTNSINVNIFNFSEETANLIIRSNNGEAEGYINWGGYITTTDPDVRYRIGKNPPKNEKMSISTNYQSTFFKNPVDIIDRLRNADTAYFRITPYGNNPITCKFLLSGLDSIISSFPNFIDEKNNYLKEVFIPFDIAPIPLSPIKVKSPKDSPGGVVIVQVLIDENGNVKETLILKGFPNTGLNEIAMEAIRKTQFSPGTQRGRPINAWISVPVTFGNAEIIPAIKYQSPASINQMTKELKSILPNTDQEKMTAFLILIGSIFVILAS
jgi:TonB family protein